MIGMFPPNTDDCYNCKLSGPEQLNLIEGGVGFPPMNIRNAASVNSDLGDFALPEGFQQVPIFSDLDPAPEVPYNDDLNIYGCPYVETVDERFGKDSTYTD
jgi:hypothetical protein